MFRSECKEFTNHNDKKKLVLVTNNEFKTNLEKMILHINNDLCRHNEKNFNSGFKAPYHKHCHRNKIYNVYKGHTTGKSKGRPSVAEIYDKMEEIFEFMDASDDSCFALKELFDVIGYRFCDRLTQTDYSTAMEVKLLL